eukprot:4213251-Prymnesium_polylepis.1
MSSEMTPWCGLASVQSADYGGEHLSALGREAPIGHILECAGGNGEGGGGGGEGGDGGSDGLRRATETCGIQLT